MHCLLTGKSNIDATISFDVITHFILKEHKSIFCTFARSAEGIRAFMKAALGLRADFAF